jgi:hypothetical protein
MGRLSKAWVIVGGYFLSLLLLFLLLLFLVHSENSLLIKETEQGNITTVIELLATVALFFEWLYLFSAILILGFTIGYIVTKNNPDKGIRRGFQITNILNLFLLIFLIALYLK